MRHLRPQTPPALLHRQQVSCVWWCLCLSCTIPLATEPLCCCLLRKYIGVSTQVPLATRRFTDPNRLELVPFSYSASVLVAQQCTKSQGRVQCHSPCTIPLLASAEPWCADAYMQVPAQCGLLCMVVVFVWVETEELLMSAGASM